MNWWKRDWKIWSAITLGILLSWSVYSFVGAEYRPLGTDSTVSLQKIETPISINRLDAIALRISNEAVKGPAIFKFTDMLEVSMPGFVSLATKGVQFSDVPHESVEGAKGEVVYDSKLGCLKINMDGADAWKTLCGGTNNQSCASDPSAGHWYCDGTSRVYKNPSTCEMTTIACELGCVTVNGEGRCAGCTEGYRECVNDSQVITCSTSGDKVVSSCGSNQICVSGQGCLDKTSLSNLPECATRGCKILGSSQCPLGGSSYQACEAIDGVCLGWRSYPCEQGTQCFAGVGTCDSIE